jgi:hypothetical protein
MTPLTISQLVFSLVLFLPEFFFNMIEIRYEHVLLSIGWLLLYCLFIWTLLGSRTINEWIYGILSVDNPASFGWYTLLFLEASMIYLFLYLCNMIKFKILRRYYGEEGMAGSGRSSLLSTNSPRRSEGRSEVLALSSLSLDPTLISSAPNEYKQHDHQNGNDPTSMIVDV